MTKRVDDFSAYARLKARGRSAEEAYAEATRKGLDPFACIRMLRSVYGLSLVQAKEVTVIIANDSSSLVEHQARLLPELKRALRDEDTDPK